MITLDRALRHTAWADDRLLAAIAAMPAEALTARHGGQGRTVADLVTHIVGGAEWYRFLLGGPTWTDLQTPVTGADVLALRDHLRGVNAYLVEAVAAPDARVDFEGENGAASAMRSTLLSQAAYHATEHRTQVAFTLECAGLPSIDLDDLDLWAYERDNG